MGTHLEVMVETWSGAARAERRRVEVLCEELGEILTLPGPPMHLLSFRRSVT